jgi:hypothetical protein
MRHIKTLHLPLIAFTLRAAVVRRATSAAPAGLFITFV